MGNEKEDRNSIAYFCHPIDETPLTPVPSGLVAKARESDGTQQEEINNDLRVLTAKEHLKNRLAATYGWDENSEKAC